MYSFSDFFFFFFFFFFFAFLSFILHACITVVDLSLNEQNTTILHVLGYPLIFLGYP